MLAEALLRRYSRVSPPVGEDRRLGRDDDRRAGAEMHGHRAGDVAVVAHEIDDAQIAGFADAVGARSPRVRSVFDTAGPVLRKST